MRDIKFLTDRHKELSDQLDQMEDELIDIEKEIDFVKKDINFGILIEPLEGHYFSNRVRSFFKDEGIFCLIDLVSMSRAEILRTPGIGYTSLHELEMFINARNLDFNMAAPSFYTRAADEKYRKGLNKLDYWRIQYREKQSRDQPHI